MTRFITPTILLTVSLVCHAAVPKAGTPRPTINDQPTGRTVTEGSPFALSVLASGSALTFQWWKGGQPVTNSTRLSGATNAVLGITPVQLADAGDYSVVVTNAGGAVTSSVASLVVTQLVFAVTALGSTGALVTVPGQVGDVYRVEVSVNFGPWLTNGFATNTSGFGYFTDHNTGGGFRNLRVRYERLLPVMYPPLRGPAPVLRVYGTLGEQWRIQGTPDFTTWDDVATVTNTNGLMKIDDPAGWQAQRFYRIVP